MRAGHCCCRRWKAVASMLRDAVPSCRGESCAENGLMAAYDTAMICFCGSGVMLARWLRDVVKVEGLGRGYELLESWVKI